MLTITCSQTLFPYTPPLDLSRPITLTIDDEHRITIDDPDGILPVVRLDPINRVATFQDAGLRLYSLLRAQLDSSNCKCIAVPDNADCYGTVTLSPEATAQAIPDRARSTPISLSVVRAMHGSFGADAASVEDEQNWWVVVSTVLDELQHELSRWGGMPSIRERVAPGVDHATPRWTWANAVAGLQHRASGGTWIPYGSRYAIEGHKGRATVLQNTGQPAGRDAEYAMILDAKPWEVQLLSRSELDHGRLLPYLLREGQRFIDHGGRTLTVMAYVGREADTMDEVYTVHYDEAPEFPDDLPLAELRTYQVQ